MKPISLTESQTINNAFICKIKQDESPCYLGLLIRFPTSQHWRLIWHLSNINKNCLIFIRHFYRYLSIVIGDNLKFQPCGWILPFRWWKGLPSKERSIYIRYHEYENTKFSIISCELWEIASKITEILNPISSISCVIPSLQVLKLILEDREDSPAGSGVKTIRAMIDNLNNRFSDTNG